MKKRIKVNYPKNSGTGTGTISLAYVNIKVEYKIPSYSLNITKVTGGYNEEKYSGPEKSFIWGFASFRWHSFSGLPLRGFYE